MEDIDGFAERALRLLDGADKAASIARECANISEYIEAVQISHLLYESAATSLNWIIERYKKNGLLPPNELYDEKRVAEENRVESLYTLESYFGSLITEPITDAFGKSIISMTPVNNVSLKELLLNGTLRNVVYPNRVRKVWGGVVDEIFQGKHNISINLLEIAPKLEILARNRFSHCFSDIPVSKCVKDIQDMWYFSQMAVVLQI